MSNVVDEEPEDTSAEESEQFQTRLAPPPPPLKPADLLPIRRTLARRVFGNRPPTAGKLREHAERYGVDGIAETAAESMSEESLTALIVSLDRINATFRRDPKRKNLYRAPAKTSPARRARELLGIEEPKES